MNIPNTIKVGSRTIEVKIGSLDASLMGIYEYNTQKITLNKNLSQSDMVATLWHEIIHAINDLNRLDATLAREIEMETVNADQQAFDLEERITGMFADVFVQVIKDNNLLKLNV